MSKARLFKFNNKGLTLIELMVASAIFLVVLMIVVSIFLTTIKNQRSGFINQNLQDNARYLMEAMIKEIRMSEIYSATGNGYNLVIINQENQKVTYKFQSSKIIRHQTSKNDPGEGAPQEISSSQVNINGQFSVKKQSNEQPRVTIVLRVTPASASQPEIIIQNTVTSRKY